MKKITKILSFALICSCSFSNAFADSNLPCANAMEESPSIADDSCTIMYVGKEVSEDGKAIISRTGDTGNPFTYHYVVKNKRNKYASQIVEGKNGFKWQMPSYSYDYTGFPRSLSNGVSLHWDVSTINEKGLAVSATLTCYTNPEVLKYDNFVPTGISEDNIAGILGATSDSSRDAMLYLAGIIDQEGSAEPNAIIALDRDEAWYMEIYSGHQYCAIRCPDDKFTTVGNEFMLNTLSEYSENEIIYSPNLFNLPKEKGFAKYDGGEDDMHMHLFNTYARPLTYSNLDERLVIDGSHMRTWRGLSLFGKDEEKCNYETDKKLPSFFTPSRKLNMNDCFTFFRDRFEDLVENPAPENDIFRENDELNKLRIVGTETSYQVHVIKAHDDLPDDIALEAWIALGNATGAPFVVFNNCMTEFPNEYVHEITNYALDEESAYYLFRRVSAIANINRKEYSYTLQKYWNFWEKIWSQQYSACLEKAKEFIEEDYNYSRAKFLLSHMAYIIQKSAIDEAKSIFDDLFLHYLRDQKTYAPSIREYIPKISITKLAKTYGYSRNINNNILTYKYNDNVIELTEVSGIRDTDSTIRVNGVETKLSILINKNSYFADYTEINNIFYKDGCIEGALDFDEITNISYKDLANEKYPSDVKGDSSEESAALVAIIIPLILAVAIALTFGILLLVVNIKNKERKDKNNESKIN